MAEGYRRPGGRRAETTSNAGTFAAFGVQIEESAADGDRITAFAKAGGRNVGSIRIGDREIAPTGRSFEVPQFGHYPLREGRIVEAWLLADAHDTDQLFDNFLAGPEQCSGSLSDRFASGSGAAGCSSDAGRSSIPEPR